MLRTPISVPSKLIRCVAVVFLLCVSGQGHAATSDVEAGREASEGTSLSGLIRPGLSIADGVASSVKNAPGAPSWLGRVHAGMEFGENLEPEFYVETVQPLYQSAERVDTVFVQPRFSYQEDHQDLYNAGLGYRRFIERANALAGVNIFGDYQDRHRHGRLGLGAEWLSPVFDARLNSYIALTPARQVDSLFGGPVYERPADGLDAEAGFPVPFVDGTRIYGGGRVYFFEETKNSYAWKSRLELKPSPWLVLNVHYSDESGGPSEWRADLRVSILFGGLKEAGRQKKGGAPDARDRALDRVEREHRIVTEKFGKGLSFFVAKA